MRIFYLSIALFLLGCTHSVGDGLRLQQVSFDQLDGWQADNHSEALSSFNKSCVRLNVSFREGSKFAESVWGSSRQWQRLCSLAGRISIGADEQAKRFFETHFQPYQVYDGKRDQGLFTGYYVAALNGSKSPSAKYRYPIYAKPKDLSVGQKYHSRKQIDGGVLDGKGLELLWTDDPVKLFFMHVQGSGNVVMQDGSVVHLSYAAKNNHQYKSLGRYLIDQGYFIKEQMSADALKKWLYEQEPEKMRQVLQHNPSYIFFRILDKPGPIGGQGVQLTKERSLAIDKKFIPYSVPIWLQTELTKTPNRASQKFHRLMIAQDTGSAIKGAVRGDIYFGYGKVAEDKANYQNSRGSYFVLLPKH